MRRLLQVFALLLVVLAGSLPGLGLAGTARTEPCHCGMPAGTCPMRMPVRSPGPAPCGPAAPVSLVSAPCRLAQAPDARKEPSPFPQAVCVRAVRLLASGPSRLARPGPARPLTPAELSVFRI